MSAKPWLICVGATLAVTASAAIDVRNFSPGDTLRNPVAILKGSASGESIVAGLDWKHMARFPVSGGQFVALVELKPGANMVLLQSGGDTTKIRLDYKPMTTPYKVAVVYISASHQPGQDAGDPQSPKDVAARIDTGLKLLQAFTAETMNDAGYGRKTFPLEFDKDGKVVVHYLQHPKTGDELRKMDGRALWSLFDQWLSVQFDYDTTKVCALMEFSRYDPATRKVYGHTALGGGALGLFGAASLYTWPVSLADVPKVFANADAIDPGKHFDDSGNRGTIWASASTTLGATLHEMGHTFGLPHSTDPFEIMSRGFDRLNRAFMPYEPPTATEPSVHFTQDQIAHFGPFFAARLNWSPWFQPDGDAGKTFPTDLAPKITYDAASGQYTIMAPYGIRVAGGEADGHVPSYQIFPKDAPTTLTLSRSDLRQKVGTDAVHVYVLDSNGNEARLETP